MLTGHHGNGSDQQRATSCNRHWQLLQAISSDQQRSAAISSEQRQVAPVNRYCQLLQAISSEWQRSLAIGIGQQLRQILAAVIISNKQYPVIPDGTWVGVPETFYTMIAVTATVAVIPRRNHEWS